MRSTINTNDRVDYYSNNLPQKYKRNLNQEIEVPYYVFGSMLALRRNKRGYSHLTIWSNLCKMLTPVSVPNDTNKHRMLHLGAAINMNDESDKKCGKRVFFTSFSFGPTENISMWTNYGIPNQEAVRIKFTYRSMQEWIDLYKKGKINVYGVQNDGSLVAISDRAKVRLVQVAYWSKKRTGFNILDPNEGLYFYDHEKYRLTECSDLNAWMDTTPYMFKDYGWDYEREVRLVLIFNKDIADQYKRVAVTFDGPFEFLLENFSNYVTRGPWYDNNNPTELADGHSLREARQSVFNGLVKMRSVCDNCKQEDKTKCNCPFKGQR